jgi:dienelactone hydrolase
MQTEVHEYDGGGVRSRGYLARPDGSAMRPGVLIVHEAPGLDAHPKRRAEMLAKLGMSRSPRTFMAAALLAKDHKKLSS